MFWEMKNVRYVEQRVKKMKSANEAQTPEISKSTKRLNTESTRFSKRIKARVVAKQEDTKIKSEVPVEIPPKHPANPDITEQKEKDDEKHDLKLAGDLNVQDIKLILEDQALKIINELKSH